MFNTISSTKGKRRLKKKEVERSVILGVLEISNDTECGSPYFVKPKPRQYRLCLLRDFINLNKKLKRKPYTMTKINKILLKLEGFQYAM